VQRGKLLLRIVPMEKRSPNRYDLPVAVGNFHQKLESHRDRSWGLPTAKITLAEAAAFVESATGIYPFG
jgi:hypothetical protein